MEYGKIISVTGMNGLFELVGSKKDGAIVKSLDDKSVKFVSSRIHNFSHLESIEVYTVNDNVNLVDVLNVMKDSAEPVPNDKDAAAVKAYFEKVYPDMDFERVYASDMKKMIKWFNLLTANEVEFVLSEEEEEEVEVEEEQEEEVVAEESPKKAADKKEKEEAPAETEAAAEEAPKKKATRKKKAEDKPE